MLGTEGDYYIAESTFQAGCCKIGVGQIVAMFLYAPNINIPGLKVVWFYRWRLALGLWRISGASKGGPTFIPPFEASKYQALHSLRGCEGTLT